MLAVGRIGMIGSMGLATRRAIGFRGPLDLISTAASLALSSRRLTGTYSGGPHRVRRSVGDVEADTRFTAVGDLDQAALLVHAGENLFLQSGNMATAPWSSTGMTVEASGVSPSGEAAFFLNETAGTANHYQSQSITWTAGAPYVISWDVKDAGRGFAHFLFNSQVTNVYANINLATGITNPATGAVIGVTSLGDGWWRVSLTITVGAGGAGSAFVGGATSLSMLRNATYVGEVGKGILVSRPQVVNGSVAKGYARTAATAFNAQSGFAYAWYDQSGRGRNAIQVTAANQPRIVGSGVIDLDGGRPALNFTTLGQVLNAPYDGAWFDGPQTLFIVARATTNVAFKHLIGNRVTSGRMIRVLANGANYQVNHINAGTAATVTVTTTNLNVLSYRYDGTTLLARANGGTDASGVGGYLTGGPTAEVAIGGQTAGAGDFVGTICEVIVYQGALSDADRRTIERNMGAYYGVAVA